MAQKRPEWDVNIKDENRWVAEQERIIALRKARGTGFMLKLLFIMFLLGIGLVALINAASQDAFMDAYSPVVFLTGMIWVLVMVVMWLRVKYLRIKYKS